MAYSCPPFPSLSLATLGTVESAPAVGQHRGLMGLAGESTAPMSKQRWNTSGGPSVLPGNTSQPEIWTLLEAEEMHRGPREGPRQARQKNPTVCLPSGAHSEGIGPGDTKGRGDCWPGFQLCSKETFMSPTGQTPRKEVGAPTCRGPETNPHSLRPDSFVPGTPCLPGVSGSSRVHQLSPRLIARSQGGGCSKNSLGLLINQGEMS